MYQRRFSRAGHSHDRDVIVPANINIDPAQGLDRNFATPVGFDDSQRAADFFAIFHYPRRRPKPNIRRGLVSRDDVEMLSSSILKLTVCPSFNLESTRYGPVITVSPISMPLKISISVSLLRPVVTSLSTALLFSAINTDSTFLSLIFLLPDACIGTTKILSFSSVMISALTFMPGLSIVENSCISISTSKSVTCSVESWLVIGINPTLLPIALNIE